MAEALKLYLVECQGMTSTIAGAIAHGRCYVVAADPAEAYKRVRSYLDKHDIGFTRERELKTITLLAEDVMSPNCGHRLYIGGDRG